MLLLSDWILYSRSSMSNTISSWWCPFGNLTSQKSMIFVYLWSYRTRNEVIVLCWTGNWKKFLVWTRTRSDSNCPLFYWGYFGVNPLLDLALYHLTIILWPMYKGNRLRSKNIFVFTDNIFERESYFVQFLWSSEEEQWGV